MARTAIQTYVEEEREEEMKQAVEEGGWNTLADYIRHMIRAGESNFADLDPRSSNGSSGHNRRVSNNELRNELNNEYQYVDDITEELVKDFKADLQHRLLQMSEDEASPVTTDGGGNYKIEQ
jgi:hypothetical protein